MGGARDADHLRDAYQPVVGQGGVGGFHATSVLLPMAMPMLEAFIAGASLMPSPIIAVGRSSLSSVTALTLSSGSRPAR